MKFYVCTALSLMLFLASCSRQTTTDQAYLTPDGVIKPSIAIVPLIDSTKTELSWSLSEELTEAVQYRISQKDKLLLSDNQKILQTIKKLKGQHNPFGEDLSWIKAVFPENDYVVFMELIEHEEKPLYASNNESDKNSSAELNLSLRLRVLDLKEAEPKIVLQEIIHESHYIPRQFTQSNFYQVPWGKDNFNISPLGLAHAGLAKEVAMRIEDYIFLSKSSSE